jgi:hypothetical protein
VALSEDGQLVATAGADGVRIWHARTGHPVLRLSLPQPWQREAVAVAFDVKGHTLIAAGGCALRRYDLESRRPLPAIAFAPVPSDNKPAPWAQEQARRPCGGVDAIAVAPDGDLVAVTTNRGLLRRFSLARGRELEPVAVAKPNAFGFVDNMTRPVISADGEWIAVGVGRELYVTSSTAGSPQMRVLTGWESLMDLDFAPSGSHLALLTSERLAIVDPGTGKLVRSQPLERDIPVSGAVRYDAGGTRLLVLATETLTAFDATTAAPTNIVARNVDDGAYAMFAVANGGLWIHPDGNERMLVRELPGSR